MKGSSDGGPEVGALLHNRVPHGSDITDPLGITSAELLNHAFSQGAMAVSIESDMPLQIPEKGRCRQIAVQDLITQMHEQLVNKALASVAEGSGQQVRPTRADHTPCAGHECP
jgi:hypothetical protein